MSKTLIHRYLLREIALPTLLCLLVFTVVLLAGRMVQMADLVIGKGASLAGIAQLLATLLPPLLAVIIPLAFLVGTMLGFGRLSADSETIALKAGGIGLLAMARPAATLAMVCAGLTLAVNFWLAPWGKREFRNVLFEMTSQQASIGLQEQVFLKQFSNLMLYIDRLEPRSGEMNGVFILEQKEESPLLIFAEKGRMHSNPVEQTVVLQLDNGVIHRQTTGKRNDAYQIIGFNSYEITPEISKSVAAQRKPQGRSELGLRELWAKADGLSPKGLALRGELHRRLCAPLAPLLFVLFAVPLSTFSQRSGRSAGFVMGVLIYLAYHAQLSLAETLTVEAGVAPWLTFWAAHLALFVAGGYFLRQSALERPVPVIAWLDRCARRLKRPRKAHAHS
jgi:lipopolysaccharide export system permease protein